MFELTTKNAEQTEAKNPAEILRELAEIQLVLVGGGGGAASLD